MTRSVALCARAGHWRCWRFLARQRAPVPTRIAYRW